MPTRNATAVWEGGLKDGKGSFKAGSGAFEGSYSFPSRFEQGPGTDPEERIGVLVGERMGRCALVPFDLRTLR